MEHFSNRRHTIHRILAARDQRLREPGSVIEKYQNDTVMNIYEIAKLWCPDVSKSVWNIFHWEHIYAFHFKTAQAIYKDDFPARFELVSCEIKKFKTLKTSNCTN